MYQAYRDSVASEKYAVERAHLNVNRFIQYTGILDERGRQVKLREEVVHSLIEQVISKFQEKLLLTNNPELMVKVQFPKDILTMKGFDTSVYWIENKYTWDQTKASDPDLTINVQFPEAMTSGLLNGDFNAFWVYLIEKIYGYYIVYTEPWEDCFISLPIHF